MKTLLCYVTLMLVLMSASILNANEDGLVMRVFNCPSEAPVGSYSSYDVGVRNNGDSPVLVSHVLAFITGPYEAERTLRDRSFVLHPGEEAVRTVSLYIPHKTPLGMYNIDTVLYNGQEEIASDSFDVEVVGK
jgi:hypothetical protein